MQLNYFLKKQEEEEENWFLKIKVESEWESSSKLLFCHSF